MFMQLTLLEILSLFKCYKYWDFCGTVDNNMKTLAYTKFWVSGAPIDAIACKVQTLVQSMSTKCILR